MKKKIFISIIVLFSLPLFIYISFELSLKLIAIPYVSKINHNEYFDAEDRFNRALWIYYTDDKDMELKKITLFGTIYKLTKTEKLMQIIKDSDNVVYMASRYIIYAENKKRNLTGLDWQVTWLAVAKWISENWDIDRCLSYLADRIYYGHGYYGLKEASTGYFDKEPKDLSIEEISMLIAATTSPSYYDIRNKDEKLLNKSDEIKEMILKSKSWR